VIVGLTLNVNLNGTIHIHVHDSQQDAKLTAIQQALTVIHEGQGALQRTIMAQFDEVDQALSALNEATNEIAASVDEEATQNEQQLAAIQALRDQIARGNAATPEQLDAVVSSLSAQTSRLRQKAEVLRGLAQDPENPVPEEPNPGGEV
jgi:methyl-accepting chemotaxis protein